MELFSHCKIHAVVSSLIWQVTASYWCLICSCTSMWKAHQSFGTEIHHYRRAFFARCSYLSLPSIEGKCSRCQMQLCLWETWNTYNGEFSLLEACLTTLSIIRLTSLRMFGWWRLMNNQWEDAQEIHRGLIWGTSLCRHLSKLCS
jgi:hypothetical protein